MNSVWFSKKRCAEMLTSGLSPFLVKGDAGDIVAATMLGEPDAAQKKKYPDYAPVLEGKALLCLASLKKCLTKTGMEYARTQGIPETYEGIFECALNKKDVREATAKTQRQRPSKSDRALMALCRDLKSEWLSANTYSRHPSNDLLLQPRAAWQDFNPGYTQKLKI